MSDSGNTNNNTHTYDSNGNLSSDNSKNITGISYNSLNLLAKVTWDNTKYTAYVYDAAGGKRQVTHRSGSITKTTDYCGSVIYEDGVIKRILTEEGYITLAGITPTYYYYLKDHLGNNRVVIDSEGAILQTNHYYPFGGMFAETNPADQPYKFGGKEFDAENGLDLHDFHARQMEPMLGRFTTMDPLAEKYYAMSPYAYAGNNPSNFVDMRGDSITVLTLTNGEHVGLLIQNDTGKWQYYSFNGDKVYNSAKGSTGGRPKDDIAVGEWDSPQQFMDSDYNQAAKNKKEKEDENINAYGYQEGYVLPTTKKQDNIIRETFTDAVEQGYNLAGNHCSIAVQKSLNAAGMETREPTTTIVNRQFGDIETIRINPYLPSAAYKSIKHNNPNGFTVYPNKK